MASGAAGLIQQIQIDDGGKHNFASTAYGICNTEANNANKVVEMTGFTLIEGTTVHIKFTYNNTVANPTLNINGTGAKPIVQYGTTVAGTTDSTSGWYAGAILALTYDGTRWVRDQGFNTNSTYTITSVWCNTAAATAAKTFSNAAYYAANDKSYFEITFRYANSAASALTLNGKTLYINGEPSSADNHTIPAGKYLVYYDNNIYYIRTDGKITGDITGNAATVNGLTVETAVPANAKFTDTNKYHKSGSWSGLTYTATAVNGADELKFTIPDNYGDTKNPYASKTKNYVLAAPSNANGVPSFRALAAADIPNLSWNKITSDKPTTLSGYGITDAKIASGVITLGSNTITPITSIADLTGSTITAANLRTNLGLTAPLRFIGKATTDISESTTTAPTVTGVTNYVPEVGDVVLDKNSDAEYVCIAKTTTNNTTTYTWELLGRSGSWATSTHTHGNITNGGLLGTANMAVVTDGSKKITTADLSVSDPTAATTTSTTFIDTISQNAQGKITVTKKTLPTLTNVTQSSNSEDKEFPIILKNTNNSTNETNGVKYDGEVTVNPNKSRITATTIQANSRLVASKAISQIITGTGTVGSYTNSTYYPAKWTFNTGLTATDGDIFTIKIPVAGHDYGVFMSVDNGSHYYPVVLNGTGRITTHYPVNTYITVIFEPTGSAASMYAVAGQTSSTRVTVTGGVWRVLNYYDSNSNDTGYYHRRIYPNLKAGGTIHPYSIIMQLPNGRWSGITTTAPNNPGKSNVSPVATGKAANASGFVLGHVLLMYANATYADANNIGTYNIWSAHTGLIDARYSFNLANSTGNGFVAYTPVYIVGTISDGLFHLDATKWWTQTLPSSDDGKVYIYIGDAYDWYRLTFTEDKPIYWYKGGTIKLYSGASEYALTAPLSGISGADDLKAIEAISGTTGLLKKTAANTWTLDTSDYVTSSGITSVTIGATSPVQSSTSTAQNGSSASTTISLKDAYGDTKNPYGAKAKNLVLAGPSSGSNAAPTFRALVAADIPNSILKWQTTTAESTALYDFGVYVNMNNANGSSMKGGDYFNILNVPYRKASGNTKADWGWQLGNTTSNDGRLWYRTAGDNVWGDWQTIAHATQSTSNIGSATQPVYMTAAGVITAGTALGGAAYKAENYYALSSHNHDSTYSYTHLSDYDFTDTRPLSKYVTFDKSRPVGAPKEEWYNGFISSHSNYHASYIINGHTNQNEWYVGHGIWREDNTPHATAPTWYLLAHSGNVGTGDNNGQVKIAGVNVSVKGLKALAYKDSLVASDIPDIGDAYLKLSGGTMTGDIKGNASVALGTTTNPFHHIVLGGTTNATLTADSTNPRITFQESNNGTQPVHLIYSDYDNYRSPAGLKIIGGTSASPAWLEVEGDVYAAAFKGNADTATTAINLSAKPILAASGSNITVTAGGKTSDAFTVPYATNAGSATTATYIKCPDTRNITLNPTDLAAAQGVRFDFKAKGTIDLTATDNYAGVMSFRPYASNSDWSGGNAHQIAFNSEGLHWRNGSASWGNWYQILDSNNTTAGANNTATLAWSTTYTIAKINGTDIKFTTMAKPSYAFTDLTEHPTTLSGYGITDAAANNHSHTLKIGNKSLSVSTSEQEWNVHDILYNTNIIWQSTSWDIITPGIYAVGDSSHDGSGHPGSTTGQTAPYAYGHLIVTRANGYGAAQFYISHVASGPKAANKGIRYRSGWNVNNPNKTEAERWQEWATILDDKNFNLYAPTLTGTGASGSWGISITGTAAKATADASGNTITSTYATKAEIESLLAAADAMIFRGIVNTANDLPNSHSAGDTYRVGAEGTYPIVDSNGRYCEEGTLIICITNGTAANAAHWTAVETNEDGAVIGPSSSKGNNIVTFSGNTGRIIQDSGKAFSTATPGSSSTDAQIPTAKAIWAAINALDANLNSTTPGAGKTLTAFSQTNGKVSATFGDISITKSQVSDFAHDHDAAYLKLNGSNNMTADINIIAGDTDKFVNFWYNTNKTAGASWRIGELGSGSSDANYFVIQSGTSDSSKTAWNDTIQIGANTFNVYLPSTTASTSTTSGALKVAGGLGVAGQVTATRLAANGSNTSYNLYVNGTSYFNGTISQNGSGYYLINAGQQYARLYIQAIGKTDSLGQSVLELGNSVGSGTANNSYGTLHLYHTDTTSAKYTATGWTGSGISNFTILGATSTTQNAAAWSTLILGNDKNVTTTDPHSQGLIRIYSKGTVYTDIQSQVATSGSHTVYLPKYGNDMYLTHVGDNNAVGSGTQPVYVAENGRITACATSVGDAYTPVYSNEGVLTATAPVQYNTFTIVSADNQVELKNDAYTEDTYVLTIVITSGEANINAPITWTSSTGKIRLQTSVAVSGDVSGYILTARGISLVN